MSEESKTNFRKAIIVFGCAGLAIIPWSMFLENLKQTNSQLSTSFFVQLLPIWLALFVYGIVKNKRA